MDRERWIVHVYHKYKFTISFPESSFPLTSGRKTRVLGTNISGMRHRCRLRSETGWVESPEFGYFKMLLPELSFSDRWSRGTKTLGTRFTNLKMISSPYCALSRVCLLFLFHVRHDKILTFRNYLHEVNSKFQNNRHYGCETVEALCFVLSHITSMTQLRSCKNQ